MILEASVIYNSFTSDIPLQKLYQKVYYYY